MPYIKCTTSMTLCMALISEGLYVWNTTRHTWLSSTNSAEEKWALLDKDIEMEDSETENEKGKGRTILHHTKLGMRREMEEQFYTTLFHFI